MFIVFPFMILLVPTLTDAGFFMQLFADSGMEVTCPSGNLVYINPISEDLQQCEQQIGSYNETTCPGGTACERFPVLVPGFQDYCCWINKTSNESVETNSSFTEAPPTFSRRGTPDRGVVEAIVEKPEPQESIEREEEQGKSSVIETQTSTATPIPEDEDSSEWEEVTPRRTKRPRNRKPTPTTTPTTTTTTKPASHGLPQCNDPSNSVFIDYGNRLRDCYFQRCERGYNCEFNKRIRRFICCGQDLGLVPPPGLPMLPAPKPLNPRRVLRPNPRPFAMQSDGSEAADTPNKRHSVGSSCCDLNDCSGGRLWEEDCDKQNTRCSNVQGRSSCENGNPKGRLNERANERVMPRPHPNVPDSDWLRNDCKMGSSDCSVSRGQEDMNSRNSERYEWANRVVGTPPEKPRAGCNMNSAIEGCPMSRGGMRLGSPFMERGDSADYNRVQRPAESSHEFAILREISEFTPTPIFPPRPFDEHRRAAVSSSLIRSKMNRLSPAHKERPSAAVEMSSAVPQQFSSFMYPKALSSTREVGKQGTPPNFIRQENSVCIAGSEYNLDGLIPSCNSNNSDFCPNSHPHCSFSSSVPHRVCCRHVIHQSS